LKNKIKKLENLNLLKNLKILNCSKNKITTLEMLLDENKQYPIDDKINVIQCNINEIYERIDDIMNHLENVSKFIKKELVNVFKKNYVFG